MVDVGYERFGDPYPIDFQQRDQRVLGGGAQPLCDQQRADVVAVPPDRMRFVI